MLTVKVHAISRGEAGDTVTLSHGGGTITLPATETDVANLALGATYALTLVLQTAPPTPKA